MEDLVSSIESGTEIGLAYVQIHEFARLYNRGRRQLWWVGAGPGYLLGNAALRAFGEVLRVVAPEPLRIYNDGPSFAVLSVGPLSRRLLDEVSDVVFRPSFASQVRKRLEHKTRADMEQLRPFVPDIARLRTEEALAELLDENVCLSGGVSYLDASPGEHPRAMKNSVDLARQLTTQAVNAAQLGQIVLFGEAFLVALEQALLWHKERRPANEVAFPLRRVLQLRPCRVPTSLLEWTMAADGFQNELGRVAGLLESGRGRPCDSVEAVLDALRSLGLNREFIVPHFPFTPTHWVEGSFSALLSSHLAAMRAGHRAEVERIEQQILYKYSWRRTGCYSYTPTVTGSTSLFEALLQHLVASPPQSPCRVVMHRGGDEIVCFSWDPASALLMIDKFDLDNIGAAVNQLGMDEALKYANAILNVVQDTPHPEAVLARVRALGLPAVRTVYPLPPDLAPSLLDELERKGQLVKAVHGDGVRVDAPLGLSGGRIHARVPAKWDQPPPEFGFLEQFVDEVCYERKEAVKTSQIRGGGGADRVAAFETRPDPISLEQWAAKVPEGSTSALARRAAKSIIDRAQSSLERAAESAHRTIASGRGFDFLIVACGTEAEAGFWADRLEEGRGWLFGERCTIQTVVETPGRRGILGLDWGALCSFHRVSEAMRQCGQPDLPRQLRSGARMALFSAAGMAKRMAPISLFEPGSKSSVRLPWIQDRGCDRALSVLEAVILISAPLAASRAGRLTVLHGDQVVISSREPNREADHPLELFCAGNSLDYSDALNDRGLIHLCNGRVAGYSGAGRARKTAKSRSCSSPVSVVSLGSYSVSAGLLDILLRLRLDSLALSIPVIRRYPWVPFLIQLQAFVGSSLLAGCKDMGQGTIVLDMGRPEEYRRSVLRLVDRSTAGDATRAFFGVRDDSDLCVQSSTGDAMIVNSLLQNASVAHGRVTNSVLVDCDIRDADVEDSVIIGSSIGRLKSDRSVVYQFVGEDAVMQSEVIAEGASHERGRIVLRASLDRDGKADWNQCLAPNELSYEEVAKLLTATDGVSRPPCTGTEKAAGWRGENTRRCLLEHLRSECNVSLVLLKGGTIGGLAVRDQIMAALGRHFDIVWGRPHTLTTASVLKRWGTTPAWIGHLRKTGIADLLGHYQENLDSELEQAVRQQLSTTEAHASTAVLRFALECLCRPAQYFLLFRRVEWSQIVSYYGMPFEAAEGCGMNQTPEADLVKRIVVGTDGMIGPPSRNLRGIVRAHLSERGILEEAIGGAAQRGVDAVALGALMNGIHAPSFAELPAETAIVPREDVNTFLGALSSGRWRKDRGNG
jgi:hypothetical protein